VKDYDRSQQSPVPSGRTLRRLERKILKTRKRDVSDTDKGCKKEVSGLSADTVL
jgi:hypothetical protein